MSIETEADRKLDRAKAATTLAISSLSQIVIERCDGHEDYNAEFKKKLRDSLFELAEIRERLEG